LRQNRQAPAESPEAEEATASITVPAHQRHKPVRKSLPEFLPRESIVYDVSDAEKYCDDCACEKAQIGECITEQLEVIPQQLKVLQHIRPKYAYKQCEAGVVIAPAPLVLLPKSMAGPSLVAHTVVSVL